MKKILWIALLLLLVFLVGCKEEVVEKQEVIVEVIPESFCGDGTCDADENTCTCQEDCGACSGDTGNKTCVAFNCVADVCKQVIAENCCGNGKCEVGEETCGDCPSCNDYEFCTTDFFDIEQLTCVNEVVTPCCGNGVCESKEDSDSCLLDCSSGVDLSDFPFLFKGKKVTIIIGAKATASDVVAGDTVRSALSGAVSALDNEVGDLDDLNAIVIGTPCDNKFSKELIPYSRDCLEYIQEGTGVIRLFKTGKNNYAVLVAGNPITMTRKAATWLKDYQKHDLEGAEVIVR